MLFEVSSLVTEATDNGLKASSVGMMVNVVGLKARTVGHQQL